MSHQSTFTLAGRRFSLSHADVLAALGTHFPEPVHQYWVEVGGTPWPVKQVLGLVTGLNRSEFTSQSAQQHLAKLGFKVSGGTSQTDGRKPRAKPPVTSPRSRRPVARPMVTTGADVVLISCTKTKLARAAAAKELYSPSDYFRKMREYAETGGRPWFILSAEHGLVHPDDMLEPYDRYLRSQSGDYKRAWGERVAHQLTRAAGPLAGKVLEVHASADYVQSLEEGLVGSGAKVINLLEGLTIAYRKQWYASRLDLELSPTQPADLALLASEEHALSPDSWQETNRNLPRQPGLYSWWVDAVGAEDLTLGLGHIVRPGLIYAGSAGATRPGGSRSNNTLWGRVNGMHLGPRREFSTLRRSLAAILGSAREHSISEPELTEWMKTHLLIATLPVEDRDLVDELERELLDQLDPPLTSRTSREMRFGSG